MTFALSPVREISLLGHWQKLLLPQGSLPSPVLPEETVPSSTSALHMGQGRHYLFSFVLAESLHGDGLQWHLAAVPQGQDVLAALLQGLHHLLVLVQGLLLVLAQGNDQTSKETWEE